MAAGKFHGVTIAHSLFGVPAEELGRIGDLAARVRQRFAVFERDQLGEAFGLRHDHLIGLAQDLGALARLAPGPAFERGLRGVDRGLGVLDARARHRGDDVLGRRIDNLEARIVGGLAPFAADPQLGRNIGEQIFIHGVPSCLLGLGAVIFGISIRPNHSRWELFECPVRACDERSRDLRTR
jgi:hypothetical protein